METPDPEEYAKNQLEEARRAAERKRQPYVSPQEELKRAAEQRELVARQKLFAVARHVAGLAVVRALPELELQQWGYQRKRFGGTKMVPETTHHGWLVFERSKSVDDGVGMSYTGGSVDTGMVLADNGDIGFYFTPAKRTPERICPVAMVNSPEAPLPVPRGLQPPITAGDRFVMSEQEVLITSLEHTLAAYGVEPNPNGI